MKKWIQMPNQRMTAFSGGSYGKETAWNVGDVGLIPGLGRSLGEKNGNPLQYSYLVLLLSHFSRVQLCVTPSLGFSRQEHWSGLPFPSPIHKSEKWKWSRSLMSDSSRPHGLQPTRLLCPWDFPGESTGVGCHSYLENYSSLDRGAWQASPRGCKESAMTEWSAFSLSKTIVFTVNFA